MDDELQFEKLAMRSEKKTGSMTLTGSGCDVSISEAEEVRTNRGSPCTYTYWWLAFGVRVDVRDLLCGRMRSTSTSPLG